MIENVLNIAAPAEKVFDFVVDVRNEPRWNTQMLHAEMLTPEPIGPLVAGVRPCVTALSYDGQLAVSLLGDNNMVDMPVLAAGVCAAFEGYIKWPAGSWNDH